MRKEDNLTTILCRSNSKISHLHCVYINNRRRYQSITQQYLKICLRKDENNYMFRPIAAIIRFSSESVVVVFYSIGMVMSFITTILSDKNLTMAADGRKRPKHVVIFILY